MGCALTWANDPADAARAYLEKLRTKNIKPEADTALSAATDKQRIDQIQTQLQRLGESLTGGKAFAVYNTRTDGDFGAVVFKQGNGLNPLAQRSLSVALVMRKEAWQAAPIPGSFHNTGAYFDDGAQKRIATLEQWMAQEQAKAVGALQQDIRDRLQKAAQAIPAQPRDASAAFLTAARDKNLDLLAAITGGAREPMPDNWPQRASILEKVCAGGTPFPPAWQSILSTTAVSALVHEESQGDKATCIYAFLDPNEPDLREPQVQALTLSWRRQNGTWSLDLPPTFYDVNAEPGEPDEGDRVFLERFPRVLRDRIKARPAGSLQETAAAFADTARRATLLEALAFADLEAEPASALESCCLTASLWRDQHANLSGGTVLLDSEVRNDRAFAAYGVVHLTDPDRMELLMVPWRQRNGAWYITALEAPGEGWKELLEWQETRKPQLELKWREMPLTQAPLMKSLPAGDAPSEDDAKRAAQAWLDAAHAGDLIRALAATAAFEREDASKQLLGRVSREILNARKFPARESVLGVQRSGAWACVSLKQESGTNASYPMLVVVATPQGPRVIPEIDLVAGGSRSRAYLNDETWKRIAPNVPKESLDALRAAFTEHQKHAAK